MFKKLAVSLCLLGLIVTSAVAHGPSDIKASYDDISRILTVTIDHSTNNPNDHYIKNVQIAMAAQPVLEQVFTSQFDNKKQLVKALIPNLKDGDKLDIKAVCNKYGEKQAAVTLSIPGYTDVTPAQAQVLIEEIADLVIIDVSPHYAAGHLPGAKHYYLPTLKGKLAELNKNKTYLVYCHADGPSRAGAQTLADNGFNKVYRLYGNYSGWVKAGYPVEK